MAEVSIGATAILIHSGIYHTRAEIGAESTTIVQTNRSGGVDCVILPRVVAVDLALRILSDCGKDAANA